MLRLNLGCGADVKSGFVNIDKYNLHSPDVKKLDITDLSGEFEAGSVDEIYAKDVLEHISFLETEKVLASWVSLLKKGGKMTIQVPDVKKQAQCLLDGTWSPAVYTYMVFGGQDNPGNYHKAGFTDQYLRSLLESAGMKVTNTEYEHFGLINDRRGNNANVRITSVKR